MAVEISKYSSSFSRQPEKSEDKELLSAVSQVLYSSGCKITGIRECRDDNVLLASVVTMV